MHEQGFLLGIAAADQTKGTLQVVSVCTYLQCSGVGAYKQYLDEWQRRILLYSYAAVHVESNSMTDLSSMCTQLSVDAYATNTGVHIV